MQIGSQRGGERKMLKHSAPGYFRLWAWHFPTFISITCWRLGWSFSFFSSWLFLLFFLFPGLPLLPFPFPLFGSFPLFCSLACACAGVCVCVGVFFFFFLFSCWLLFFLFPADLCAQASLDASVLMLPSVVHRFWWHPGGLSVSPTAVQSLRCISPHPQILWTYDRDSVTSLAASIPGLAICSASLLLDWDLASALVTAGLHLCLLKDWIAALAIYNAGGLFLDLDYIWLGRQLPLVDGLAFGTEPIKLLPPQRLPRRRFTVLGQAVRLNVGLLAGPKASQCFAHWALTLHRYWHGKLQQWVAGRNCVARGRNHPLWLSNTDCLHDYIVQHALQPCLLPVHKVAPWPLWMTDYLAPGSTSYGYKLPDLAIIQQEGLFVNLWESQWLASAGGERVRDLLAQVQEQRNAPGVGLSLRAPDTLTGSPPVQSQGPRKLQPPSFHWAEIDSKVMQDLYLSCSGPDTILGWTARGFRSRNQDAAIFATLSRVSFKGLAAHLYKAARGKVSSAFHIWGPLTTLILAGDQWHQHSELARNTAAFSVWIILSGALEFHLPGRVPKVFGVGTVIVSDLLLRGGSVAKLTSHTRVLWATIPRYVLARVPSREQTLRARGLKQEILRVRKAGRRSRGKPEDVRARALPGCADCTMAELLLEQD